MKNLLKRHYIIILVSAVILTAIAVTAVTTARHDQRAVQPTQSIEKPVKAKDEQKEKAKEEKKEGATPSKLPGKKEYESIQNGMTVEEVKSKLGAPSSESESEIGNIKTKTNIYDGNGDLGANIVILFDNGKVTSKSQFGLK